VQDLPHPWREYLGYQRKLANSSTIDVLSWGREAALNRILSNPALCSPPSTEEINRAARSERRRERHRERLRLMHLPRLDHVEFESAALARIDLRKVRAQTTAVEWVLLSEVAEGRSYDEIAASTGVSSGALRVRILRIRHRIAGTFAA